MSDGYQVTCSKCGKDCVVPFQPRTDRPVLCKECFEAKKASQAPKNTAVTPAATKEAPRVSEDGSMRRMSAFRGLCELSGSNKETAAVKAAWVVLMVRPVASFIQTGSDQALEDVLVLLNMQKETVSDGKTRKG